VPLAPACSLKSPISASNLGTIRALVSAGLGVAILPRVALELPGPASGIRFAPRCVVRVVDAGPQPDPPREPAARFADFLKEGLRP
jgi:DNA-binding transcriptional LysR family regulator